MNTQLSFGRVWIAASCCAALVVSTACGNKEADVSLGRAILHGVGGDEATLKIPIKTIQAYRGERFNDSVVRKAAGGLDSSTTWRQVQDSLASMNEATDGPAREIILESACDAAYDNNYSQQHIDELIQEHAKERQAPAPAVAIASVIQLAQRLRDAEDSDDPGQQASLALICFAVGSTG